MTNTPPIDFQEPTLLRWGLDDLEYGDDGSVTVLLSGPAGEPYWLELEPERAAALRDGLAGPDGDESAVDRAAVLLEAAQAQPAAAYSDGKDTGRVCCLTCPRPADVTMPLTIDAVADWELCPSCGRRVVDVARTAIEAQRDAKEDR